jgi:methionyl-tRNA formyltransferase
LKVVIITSDPEGTAPNFIFQSKEGDVKYQITGVIEVQNTSHKNKRFYVKKLRKAWKIGFLGTLNGIRIRKWFNQPKSEHTLELLCAENNIPHFKVETVNSPKTLQFVQQLNSDLGISLGNSFISKKVFQSFPMGMINIHGEILPEYQNAQSIIWQLYNNSDTTGYTIHKIDDKIDQGDILLQEKQKIEFKKTLSETVSHNAQLISQNATKGLIELLKNFDQYYLNARKQHVGITYTTPSFWRFLRIYFNYRKLSKQQGKS